MECKQHIRYHFNALQLFERIGNFTRQNVQSRPNSCSIPSANPTITTLSIPEKGFKEPFYLFSNDQREVDLGQGGGWVVV